MNLNERIIKDKSRVQNHGEVFTPKKIVKEMLNLEGIIRGTSVLRTTFLEPTAGEGAFLIEILRRKLELVNKEYNDNLTMYENYSLFVLTTVYGIELLEDNAQNCVMNIFEVFYENYGEQALFHNGKKKKSVLESAKTIISSNISQGNFLTRKKIDGELIVFSEWLPRELKTSKIIITRTEFTIEEIINDVKKDPGSIVNNRLNSTQMDLFEYLGEIDNENNIFKETPFKYIPTNITNIYKKEMEESF